ncbi:hypothetical protein [Mycobacterium sp. SMC-4]|uniref:hypothetical protein n=1 Tax=Mycobacterium sp. SMC-4 TaxID=2857059 RepID=UPI003D0749C5
MANANNDPGGALKAALDVYLAALPADEFNALVARTREPDELGTTPTQNLATTHH